MATVPPKRVCPHCLGEHGEGLAFCPNCSRPIVPGAEPGGVAEAGRMMAWILLAVLMLILAVGSVLVRGC